MKWMILAVAGALGTLARVGMSTVVQKSVVSTFPWGVTAVNLAGSLLFGILFALVSLRFLNHPQAQAFFLVGFLGAFTTFSTLMFETVRLMQTGQMLTALGLLLMQNILGLLLFWLGLQSVALLNGKVFQ
ncbi:CrcB family protein [Myxococcota bacterium]|nr:CrcB family protein [Myxococcota bacterium]